MNNNHVNQDQQVQNEVNPKKKRTIVMKVFVTIIRLINIICTVVNYFEGGSE